MDNSEFLFLTCVSEVMAHLYSLMEKGLKTSGILRNINFKTTRATYRKEKGIVSQWSVSS